MHKELRLPGFQPTNMMWRAVAILPIFAIAFHLRMLEEDTPIDFAQLGQIVEKTRIVQRRVYVGKNESVTTVVDGLRRRDEVDNVVLTVIAARNAAVVDRKEHR